MHIHRLHKKKGKGRKARTKNLTKKEKRLGDDYL